jgi:hypothetical protein
MNWYSLVIIIAITFTTPVVSWKSAWKSDNSLFFNNNTLFTMISTNVNQNLLFQLNFSPKWSFANINSIDPNASPTSCNCNNNLMSRWVYWAEPYSMLRNVADEEPENIPTTFLHNYSQKLVLPYDTCTGPLSSSTIVNSIVISNQLMKWPVPQDRAHLFTWWFLSTRKINLGALGLRNVYVTKLAQQDKTQQWKQVVYSAVATNNIIIQNLNTDLNIGTIQSDEFMMIRGNICSWLNCFQQSKIWDDDTLICI